MDSAAEAVYLSGGQSPSLEKKTEPVKGEFKGRAVCNIALKGLSLAVYIPTVATELTSVLCHPLVAKAAAGTGFALAWTVDKALAIPHYIVETGALHSSLSMLEPATREVITQSLQNAENTRDAQGEVGQKVGDVTRYAMKTIKVLSSAIPFAGALTEAVSTGVEIGQKVEQLERKAEQAHMGWTRSVLSHGVSAIKAITPAVFSGAAKLTQVARMPVGWVKDRAFDVWTNPEAPQQRLQNLTDRLDSYSSRMWHCFEAVHAPEEATTKTLHLAEEISYVTEHELEQFNEKEKKELEELLYLLEHCKGNIFTHSEKAKFTSAIKKLLEGKGVDTDTKKGLIALEKALPKGLLTPLLFQQFDELVQLKVFSTVLKRANLTPKERAFLLHPDFRHLKIRGDFARLNSAVREKLERLLVEKFNTLTPDDRTRILALSPEQFKELEAQQQSVLIECIPEEKLSSSEKAKLQELKTLFKSQGSLTALHHIKSLLKIYNAHFKGQDNLKVQSKLTSVTSDASSLKLAEPLSASKVEIDAAKINQKIGLWVGSSAGGWTKSTGSFLHTACKAVGMVPWALSSLGGYLIKPQGIEISPDSDLYRYFNPLVIEKNGKYYLRGSQECSSIENWFEIAFNSIASTTELLLLLPFVPQKLVGYLGQLGIGIETAERMLNMAPAALYKLVWTTLQYVPSGIKGVTAPISWLAERVDTYEKGQLASSSLERLATAQSLEAARMPFLEGQLASQLTEICKCTPDSPQELFICKPELFDTLTKPGFWEAMAKDLNLPPESTEFYKALTDKLQRGEIPMGADPQMAAGVVESITSFFSATMEHSIDIGNQAKENLWGMLGSMYAATLGGTRVGILAETAKDTIQGVVQASGIPDAIGGAAKAVTSKITGALSETAGEAGHMASRLVGTEQKIPEALLNTLQTISQQYGHMAEGKAMEEIARLALFGAEELNKSWYAGLIEYAAHSPNIKGMLDLYTSYLRPGLQGVANGITATSFLGQASQQFLELQLAAKPPVDITKQAFDTVFSGFEKDLASSLSKEGSYTKEGLSGIGATATLLQMAKGSYALMPIVIRHTLPPLLRAFGKHGANVGQSVFYAVAAATYQALNIPGTLLEEGFKGAGSTAQYALNSWYKGKWVAEERIKNFVKLEPEEKAHLLEIAIGSRAIHPEDKAFLKGLGPIGLENESTQEKAAKCILKAYDMLATDELLNLSPTYFDQLTPEKRERVIDIVENKVGLDANERLNRAVIVAKFNTLPESIKKEIDTFSLWDYGQLSNDEQEDILFQIAHSRAYLLATTTEHPMSPFDTGELINPTIEWHMQQFHRLQQMSTKELKQVLRLYNQLDPSEKNIFTPSTLRKCAAGYNSAHLNSIASIVSTYNAEIAHDIKTTGYDLSRLKSVLRAIKEQSKTRVPDPGLLKERDELLEGLAFACNHLRAHQQQYLLHFTPEEYEEMSPDKKVEFISFLLSQPLPRHTVDALKAQLIKIQAKQPDDPSFAVDAFNSLAVIAQADFRQQAAAMQQAQEDTYTTVRKELEAVSIKLKIVNKSVATHSGRLTGLQLLHKENKIQLQELEAVKELQKQNERIATLKEEITTIKKNIAAGHAKEANQQELAKKEQELANLTAQRTAQKQQIYTHLKQRQTLSNLIAELQKTKGALEAELSALSTLLPEDEQQQYLQLKGPPLPPEWMRYVQAATTICANISTERIKDASQKILESSSTDPVAYVTTVNAQRALLYGTYEEFKSHKGEAIEKAAAYEEESKKTKDPAKKIIFEYKAAFARNFYAKLEEEFEKAYEKLLRDFDEFDLRRYAEIFPGKAGRTKDDLLQAVAEKSDQEELNRVHQKLTPPTAASHLSDSIWNNIREPRELRGAIGDTLVKIDQQILSMPDRKILAKGLLPKTDGKSRAFEALSLNNQLVVLLEALKNAKDPQHYKEYIDRLCESIEASNRQKVYLSYLQVARPKKIEEKNDQQACRWIAEAYLARE